MQLVISRNYTFCLSEKGYETLLSWGVPLVDKFDRNTTDLQIKLNPNYETNPYRLKYLDNFSWPRDFIKRSNPLLIRLAEIEDSSVYEDSLAVIEVPDDIKLLFCSNDVGDEWVAEEHRIWS